MTGKNGGLQGKKYLTGKKILTGKNVPKKIDRETRTPANFLTLGLTPHLGTHMVICALDQTCIRSKDIIDY